MLHFLADLGYIYPEKVKKWGFASWYLDDNLEDVNMRYLKMLISDGFVFVVVVLSLGLGFFGGLLLLLLLLF